MVALSILSTALRFLCSFISNQGFWIDDLFILIALIFTIGVVIVQFVGLHAGLGQHILLISSDQFDTFFKYSTSGRIIFAPAALAIKLSILFFYHRLFPLQRFRTISIIIGIVSIVWFVEYEILQFVTCLPFSFNWDKTIPGGHCLDALAIGYYGTIPPDVLTNIAILVLPIPYVWGLQMSRSRKLFVSLIFLLGGFATVGSIVRFPMIHEISADITWSGVNYALWISVECNVGVLSANLPVLRPLVRKDFASRLRSRFSKEGSYASEPQHVPDVERSANTGGSTLGSRVFQGKGHKSWYNSNITSSATKGSDRIPDGSQEDMMPLGVIGVKHDLTWEERQRDESRTP